MRLHDRLDAVDRRLLALLKQPRRLLAAQLDERADAVVADRREMRRGARGHAAADRAAVDHDDRLAGLRQFIGAGQAGNAGAHDHGIAALIAAQARRVGRDLGLHPQ